MLIAARDCVDESCSPANRCRCTSARADPPIESRAGPGGEDPPIAVRGTLLVRGSGMALVHATGATTESDASASRWRDDHTAPRLQARDAAAGARLCAIAVSALGAAVRRPAAR